MTGEIRRFRASFPPSGPGLVVNPELRELSDRPGFLQLHLGGQRMRDLYVDGSAAFEPSLLSDFGLACFMGLHDTVKEMVESGSAPDILGHETAYRHGYLTLVVSGRQRISDPAFTMRHKNVAKYLLDQGAPPDLPDIAGYTALQHATIRDAVLDVARVLLEGGANPDHQNKYGCTALMDSCLTGSVPSIDLLLEFGADPDIADADDCKPSIFCTQAGPQVNAVMAKWKRKRNGGEAAAWEDNKCASCSLPPTDGATLRVCSRCRSVRYCSSTCQRSHWSIHKLNCQPLDGSNTLTLTPYYQQGPAAVWSQSTFVRNSLGMSDPFKSRSEAASAWPAKRELPKHLVIKIQLPFAGFDATPAMQSAAEANGSCLVYTKKRDLMCNLRRNENGPKYDRLVQTIKAQGARGLKAYFAAEMTRKDELVIKVDKVLAEQPF